MSKKIPNSNRKITKNASGLLVLPEDITPLIYSVNSRAILSKEGTLLTDKKAEKLVELVAFRKKRAHFSRLADLYVGILTTILDDHTEAFLADHPDAVVLHLGCGLDSRVERIKGSYDQWYDVDLPDVIAVRKRFYKETDRYHMIAASVTGNAWLDEINAEGHPVIILAEGLMMYLSEKDVSHLFINLCNKFPLAVLIFDTYSMAGYSDAVKRTLPLSKQKKMTEDDLIIKWGLDDPTIVEKWHPALHYLKTMRFSDSPRIESLTKQDQFEFHMMRKLPLYNHLYLIYFFSMVTYNPITPAD
ncbi:hypothetical protein SDC9_50323 [bioreactor metagenome]|uniref:Uncharacterized protein n=1 Tax=bioreactor metagenome TaxID=1076179 RepID=A0A644WP04_9ZZZZ